MMHMLTIAFGGMGMAWKFGFKTAEAAERAYTTVRNPPIDAVTIAAIHVTCVEIEDDFGQRSTFNPANISGVLLENMDEAKVLHVEHAIQNAKTQAMIQQRAQSDPTLKFASANGPGGPAMISPMMGRQ